MEYKTCMVDNCLYVAGGNRYTSLVTNEVYVYKPVPAIWTKCCSMYVPRKDFYFGELDGHLYAVSGRTFITRTPTVEKYIPQKNRWAMLAPLPVDSSRPAGCACNGLLYLSGGLTESGTSNRVWRYNPDLNNWTEMARMLSSRAEHIMTCIGNKVFAIGGSICEYQFFAWNDVMSGEIYDCEANQWTNLLTLKMSVLNKAFFTSDNCIYIIGQELNFRHHFFNTFVQKINLRMYLDKITASGNHDSNTNDAASNAAGNNNNDDGCQVFRCEVNNRLDYCFFGIVNSSKLASE
ncbi:hypothetical protein HELRODRAFT_108080 [Helobdella robusta]|uniref:BACK domain-containing protein n=1 Tax=Helobdella robusta TaxID=6412 RepID=T1EEF1_HELRO|nr:hypothetical protein HELRODRAFT_108080 [Helobdella robusta]ESN92673.1 hypothetical protein HELRODRAFT_108080 [Helobdella robusta]